MEDQVSFKKKMNSYIKRAEEGNVCLTSFLDEAEISIVNELCKFNGNINAFFDGGFIDSERKRCILSSYLDEYLNYKINVYKIIYNKKFFDVNHRSILGSLMSLGIKRECVGDILVLDNKDAFFACSDEISSFIEENLTSIGRASIKLERINYPLTNEVRYESDTYFLSSMRLDVTICAIYGFSRSEILEVLTKGEVFVNQILNQNPSYILKENDLVSVRHKGKFIVSHIGGNSRSGRIICELSKRV